ncbi:CpsD/CapB family tyrosine-protein kinase [Paenibacillus tarimensis]
MRRSASENNLITLTNPYSPISETYRTLRINLQYTPGKQTVKAVMVTSSISDEGKTTTLSNLAVAYAQEGKGVLVIDADLRNPSLHDVFSQLNQAGLSDVLVNKTNWQEAINDTAIPNLSILTAGVIPSNPSEMLASKQMAALIEELKERYDILLIDTPPVLAVPDPLIVNAYCDGVLLVVAAGKADKETVKKAKASLERVNARILGAVFNKMNRKDAKHISDYAYGR